MKKFLTFILVVALIVVNFSFVSAKEGEKFEIKINGQVLNIPAEMGSPYIDEEKRTQVPARAIIEGLGYTVNWNGQTQTVIILDQNENEVATLQIGSKVVHLANGKTIEMDTNAQIGKDGRTYIPLRFVSQALGFEIPKEGGYKFQNGVHQINIVSNTPVIGEKSIRKITEDINAVLKTTNKNMTFTYLDEGNVEAYYRSFGLNDHFLKKYTGEVIADGLPKAYITKGAFVQPHVKLYSIGKTEENNIIFQIRYLEYKIEVMNQAGDVVLEEKEGPNFEMHKNLIITVFENLAVNKGEGKQIWDYWRKNHTSIDYDSIYTFGDTKVMFKEVKKGYDIAGTYKIYYESVDVIFLK